MQKTQVSQRYIPPGARRGHSVHVNQSDQRSLSELSRSLEDEKCVVKLKSRCKLDDIPAINVKSDDSNKEGLGIQMFELSFDQKKLREVFKWFRDVEKKDSNAVMEFPPSLNKGRRQQIHKLAQTFGLGTSSQGFGDQRFISVYSTEKKALGVGRMYLTRDEQEKAEKLWTLIKERDNPDYFRFSLNEIREMILADKLDPALQELWDRKQSPGTRLADDFSRKCLVEGQKNKEEKLTDS